MKNLVYCAVLIPLLGYSGGEFLPIEVDYDNVNIPVEVEVEHIKLPEKKVVHQIAETKPKKVVVVPTSSPFYAGLSVGTSEIDGQSDSFILNNGHPKLVVAKLGYNIHENIAVEGRAAKGLSKQTVGIASSEIDSVFGLYVKPNVNVSKNINLYGLLGYAQTKQKISTENITTTGASYGAGIGYKLNNSWNLVTDVVRYSKKGTEQIDSFSVGAEYNF